MIKFNDEQREQEVRGELKKGDEIDMAHLNDPKVIRSLKKPGMWFHITGGV